MENIEIFYYPEVCGIKSRKHKFINISTVGGVCELLDAIYITRGYAYELEDSFLRRGAGKNPTQKDIPTFLEKHCTSAVRQKYEETMEQLRGAHSIGLSTVLEASILVFFED